MTRHLLSLLALAAIVGCDQSKSDMGDQPKVEAYDASKFYADGASIRPAVAGTVPRADTPGQPYGTLRTHDPAGGEDWLPAAAKSPMPVTRDLLEQGQTAFLAQCSACHGALANGNGMIVQRGFPMPPSFHVERLKAESDAHFFNVITHGYGAMYAYGDRIVPEDRWAIVAYVRALQAAPTLAGDALSPADRATLLIGIDANASKRGAP